MISFDTNILVYATASVPDVKAVRARDLIARAMRAGWTILLLQTLAEFPNVAIRKSVSLVRRGGSARARNRHASEFGIAVLTPAEILRRL
jgi:predicted nucleic acid-binding protein